MSKAKDEMRVEYRREDLGKGVRGKYYDRAMRGTNLVLLDAEVAKAFPTSRAVNDALLGLLTLARQSARANERKPTARSAARRKAALPA